MIQFKKISRVFLLNFCVLIVYFLFSIVFSGGVTTFSENRPPELSHIFVIDAGHGGVDGGATSVSGILESQINLSVCKKLNDTMHLLGLRTTMVRTEDISVYTNGNTIAQKKISDLKYRVNFVNNTPGAVLISIHQNYFADSRYSGAQTFYSSEQQSKDLAVLMQNAFIEFTNTNRSIKPADGVYLMQHVTKPAVLIECGFISNYQEEALLLDHTYQLKLAAIISCVCSEYTNLIT